MTKANEDWPLLKATRNKLGITQAEMAKRMHTPLVTYKAWETGRFNPPGVAIAFCRLMAEDRINIDPAEVVSRYIAGETATSIAADLGISLSGVQYHLRKARVSEPRGGKKIDPTVEDQIVSLHKTGTPLHRISNLAGVSMGTVVNVAKRNGLSARAQGKRIEPLVVDQIVSLYKTGVPIPKIADVTGVSTKTVINVAKRNGLSARPDGRKALPRAARESIAIDTITDVYGDDWLVSEYRPTAHGFDIAMGWLVDMQGPGNPRTIMTVALAEYLLAVDRPRDITLPIGRTVIKRLRAELDIRFSWDAWWASRAEDLQILTLEAFAAKHGCSIGAASQRRAALRSALD